MIKIAGAEGNIQNVDSFLKKIENFEKDHNIVIQVFNADLIFGEKHILSAAEHAVRSVKRKTNTTKSLGMEILLYASGDRQLKLAIPKMGVKKGKNSVAFVLVNRIGEDVEISNNLITKLLDDLSLKRNDEVLEGNRDTLKKFGINDEEVETVTKDKYGNLILEKVAMVDIIK